MRKIALVGGAGFVGSHLASRLVEKGFSVRVLTRSREKHRDLWVLPTVEVVTVDFSQQSRINQSLAGCEAVINTVGILNESGDDGAGFRKAHVELLQQVIEACQVNKIQRFLHVSALNADAEKGASHYLRSKGAGEQVLKAAKDLQFTIFRPSVIFGSDDSFFNRFAGLLNLPIPFFPLACPDSVFAPVWVEDVVSGMLNALDNPATYGKTYELCGDKQYTLRALVAYTAKLIGVKRWIIGLNPRLSELQATVFDKIPGKPLSLDNYRSLQVASVCKGECEGLRALGVTPYTIESIMPRYFLNPSVRRDYDNFRHEAGR